MWKHWSKSHPFLSLIDKVCWKRLFYMDQTGSNRFVNIFGLSGPEICFQNFNMIDAYLDWCWCISELSLITCFRKTVKRMWINVNQCESKECGINVKKIREETVWTLKLVKFLKKKFFWVKNNDFNKMIVKKTINNFNDF